MNDDPDLDMVWTADVRKDGQKVHLHIRHGAVDITLNLDRENVRSIGSFLAAVYVECVSREESETSQ